MSRLETSTEITLITKRVKVEALIEEVYGQKYSILDRENLISINPIGVFARIRDYTKEESELLESFKQGDSVDEIIDLIMIDLAKNGVIDPGIYRITL